MGKGSQKANVLKNISYRIARVPSILHEIASCNLFNDDRNRLIEQHCRITAFGWNVSYQLEENTERSHCVAAHLQSLKISLGTTKTKKKITEIL